MNLALLCARLKPVFLSKKGPSKARLLTKMSSSKELGTLCMFKNFNDQASTMKVEWADHLRRNHARLNRKDSRANRAGPRKRCDFCGDQVILNMLEIDTL